MIKYAIDHCSLGSILIARSNQGITAVMLDDDADILKNNLLLSFSHAELNENDVLLADYFKKIIQFIETPHHKLTLPIDIEGTVFQKKVWKALQKIPLGQTASYADIAKQVGSPNAVRAVGSACGANPVAIVIPCHRVVKSDGSLSGYRWGVERKRILIQREKL